MRRPSSIVTAGATALGIAVWFVVNLHAPAAAAAVDPSTAVRGSLGVPLEDLAIHSTVGNLTLYLNGALALLFACIAGIVVRVGTRKRNGMPRTVRAPGGTVRAAMGEAWTRTSRPLGG